MMSAFTVLLSLAAPPGTVNDHTKLPLSWLWSWASLRPALAAVVGLPAQVNGGAPGSDHYVPASRTRANGGAGRANEASAAYTMPSKKSAVTTTAGQRGFDPATSRRDASRSTATTQMYINDDGTLTRKVFPRPVNYRAADGSWQPIDTTLARGSDGRLRTTQNSLQVSLAERTVPTGRAAVATATDLATLALPTGETISYGLDGAAAVSAVVDGPTATYPDILPNTDMQLTAFDSGLTEILVLKTPDAPSSWLFPLRLSGLAARLEVDGSVGLYDAAGAQVAMFPHGSMEDSNVDVLRGSGAHSPDVTFELVDLTGGGQALRVTADSAWLHDPARVYPVKVDPTTATGVTGDVYVDNDSSTTASDQNGSDLSVGTWNSGTNKARSFIHFDDFGTAVGGYRVTVAKLKIYLTWAYSCATYRPYYVSAVTQSWTVANLSTSGLPGPTYQSTPLGTFTETSPGAACTNTNGNRSVGKWEYVPLNTSVLNAWSNGTMTNNGIAITASETDSYGWKRFTAANYAAGAYMASLELTYSSMAPQVDAQYPPSGYVSDTLRPELMVAGHDPDGFPKALKYDFKVLDGDGATVADSGYVSTRNWVVPAGALKWGKTYVWTVTAWDGQGYSTSQTYNSLATAVPQPAVTSTLAPNGDRGFDPSGGNYTMSATDVSVSTVGPALAIERAYNSADPRSASAFGTAWSSIVDARATEQYNVDGSVKTVVVTYPTGSEVAFGKDPAPATTFSAPAGRFATLSTVTGGYQLVDKSGTTYTFTHATGVGGQYGITSIADAQARTETFTYNGSGQLSDIVSASGRALHLTWAVPAGTSTAHVSTVFTDRANLYDPNTVSTWTYGYTGDLLTSVCPPDDLLHCTVYTYATTSQSANATLNLGPASMWRLGESTGDTAVSQVLENQGTDNGIYTSVTLGQAGPHPGSSATAAGFNGTGSSVKVVPAVPAGAGNQSLSVWFKTTATNGVLFGQSARELAATTSNEYVPVLYVGSDGKLIGQFGTAPVSGLLGSLSGGGSGRCLDVQGGSNANGTKVQLYDCAAVAGQQWTWTATGELRVTIGGVTKCMEAAGSATPNGTQIQINTCNNLDSQKWTVGTDGQIVGLQSGRCVDASGYGTANGTKIQLWDCGSPLQTNQVWFPTTHASINSNVVVNDGQWHHAALSAASTTQTLYVDGVSRGTLSGVIADAGQKYSYVGAGFLGGGWPNQSHASTVTNLGYAGYFNGSIADVTLFARPISAQEVGAIHSSGTSTASLLATLVRPSGNTSTSVTYDPVSGDVATVTDANGGMWQVNQPTYAGSSQVYVSAVLGDRPAGYWRLGEVGTTDAVNQVNGNTAAYAGGVTRGGTGGVFTDQPKATFDGTSGTVTVPGQDIATDGQFTAEAWFNTTQSGMLLAGQSQLLGSVTCPCLPLMWVAPDGSLRGLAPTTDTVGPLFNKSLNKCMDDAGGSTANGTHIQVYTCNGTPAQAWTFTTAGTVTYGGKCMDVTGSGTANGTKVQLWQCTGAPNQQWEAVVNGLRNPASGKCLDDPAGATNGTQLQIYTCNGTAAQQWVQGLGTTATVTDGAWHHAVITVSGATQSLYLDGALAGSSTASASITGTTPTYAYLGAGSTGDRFTGFAPDGDSYFNGAIAEFALYRAPLSAAAVSNHFSKRSQAGGLPVKTTTVVDPGTYTITNTYDLATGQLVAEVDALGNKTQYGYDAYGFLTTVTDPNGNTVVTERDVRGNVLKSVTCQDQSAQLCSTVYYTYFPEDTTDKALTSRTPTANLKNDVLLSTRDGRSASGTDNTYRTTYGYDTAGNRTSVTDPLGHATTTTYTTASTPALDGGFTPAGLPLTSTTASGRTQSFSYNHNGDLAGVVDPAGLHTFYTYDGLGQMLTKTVTSDTFPSGLTTTYTYDKLSRLVAQEAPPITNRVTGAVHTAKVSTVYNYDSQVTQETVQDLTGGDASRTTSSHYNAFGQQDQTTDAVGNHTDVLYDVYGNISQETNADNNVVVSTWDPEGHLLTSTLKNYIGDPNNPSPPSDLIVTSNTYDPAGRLASTTDAMGWVTSYTYTDNNLAAAITRTDPSTSASFVQRQNTYNAAGDIVSQTTNNGATTVAYAIDAADRTTATTVDPSGLNRTTSYTYNVDDAVVSVTQSDGTGTLASTDIMYDPAGRVIARTAKTAAFAPVARWKLDENGGTTAADSAGNSPATTIGGVTWSTDHGGSAVFNGSNAVLATSGPVVDTSRSFTVSGWAYVASNSQNQAIFAQEGNLFSGFYLKFDHFLGDRWNLTMEGSDSGGVSGPYVLSSPAATNTWTHLAAVFDDSTKQLKLYVNGSSVGTATVPSNMKPWTASSSFVVGRLKWYGFLTNFLNGKVSDVQAYTKALSATEIGNVYNGTAPAADAGVVRTSYKVDEAGLVTASTDPRGNTTDYSLDEAGRVVVVTEPAVSAETGGGSPIQARPVSYTGYDTFGSVTEVKDPRGNISVNAYDAAGRLSSTTLPSYTPPGSSTPIVPVASRSYTSLGQVASTTDPLSRTSTYSYDQLGNLWKVVAPNTGITTHTYDTLGDRLTTTDPTGAVTSRTYDYLGRVLTDTIAVRQTGQPYTTVYGYGSNGWLANTTSHQQVTTSAAYNAAGEMTSTTDGADKTTSYLYDGLGRRTRTTLPDTSYTTTSYDMASRPISQSEYAVGGTLQATTSRGYDRAGNVVAATDAAGHTSSFVYDASNLLTSQYEPINGSDGITSTFGYDLAGNRTRFTDGRGNAFITTYNSLGLLESQVEPATTAYPNLADRTFTLGYNAGGELTSSVSPGGVSVTNTYNPLGQLATQTGTGAEAATVGRTFGYDLAGRMTSASAPGGTDTFGYDDRGLLTSTTGPSGVASFAYTGDGLLNSRIDAAGTTTYGYDGADRLQSITNTGTGVAAAFGYNDLSQVSTVTYGGTGNVRSFGYDPRHRLWTDELKTPAPGSALIAKIVYGYDANGNETSKQTVGFAGATTNTYTYDWANRLTSWYDGTTTTAYAYDKSGNRLQAGSKTFTYDQRNQLLTGPSSSYTYTARGTLRTRTTSGTVTNTLADAFGQVVSQETAPASAQTYQYDGLGRSVKAGFSYTGAGNILASDGSTSYTRDPGGGLVGAASGGTNRLVWTDQHTDVVGQFTATATTLAGSSAYDPLGAVLSSTGMVGTLGYQSEWTDFNTGRVNMAARWYNTDTGQFDTRDTWSVSPSPASIGANRFAYGDANPLTATDPSGHCSNWFCKAAKSVGSTVASGATTAWNGVRAGAEWTWNKVTSVANWAKGELDEARELMRERINAGRKWLAEQVDKAKKALATVVDKTKQAGRAVAAQATRAAKAVGNAVADGAKAAAEWAKKHANQLIVFGVGAAVNLLCAAVLSAATAGAGALAVPTVCGAISGGISAAVSKYLDCRDAKAKAGQDCSAAGYLKTVLVGIAGGAVGGIGGALGGKLANAVISKGLGLLGRISLGALTGAVAGAASGAAAGGVTAAVQYGLDCGASERGCSLGGLAGAAGQGAVEGAKAGAVAGGIGGGMTSIRPPKATPQAPSGAKRPGQRDEQNTTGSRCPVPGHSFAAGTLVAMAGGGVKPIEDIAVGDSVVSTDPESGLTTDQQVELLHINRDSDLVDVRVAIARPGGQDDEAGTPVVGEGAGTVRGPTPATTTAPAATVTLHTTAHHPFWDVTDLRWVDAADLIVGHQLRTATGELATVVAVTTRPGVQVMHDLTVSQVHTYYVIAGSTPVLVHNNNCGTAEVYLDSANGHASVRITGKANNEPFDLHTELVGLRTASIRPFSGKLGPGTMRLDIELPDPEGAFEYVDRQLKKPDVGPYDSTTNNCITYVLCVLNAGGHYDAPLNDADAGITWLWNKVEGKFTTIK